MSKASPWKVLFIVVGTVLGLFISVVVILVASLLMCFEEPATYSEMEEALKSEAYSKVTLRNAARYEKVMNILLTSHAKILAQVDSAHQHQDCTLFGNSEQTYYHEQVLPDAIKRKIKAHLTVDEQKLFKYELCKNGDITIHLVTKENYEQYLEFKHSITNVNKQEHQLVKSKRINNYFYRIEVSDIFNRVDPCNFAPN